MGEVIHKIEAKLQGTKALLKLNSKFGLITVSIFELLGVGCIIGITQTYSLGIRILLGLVTVVCAFMVETVAESTMYEIDAEIESVKRFVNVALHSEKAEKTLDEILKEGDNHIPKV